MLLVAFLHTLEAIVQTIFFVIFEIGLGNRVSACQIDLGSGIALLPYCSSVFGLFVEANLK